MNGGIRLYPNIEVVSREGAKLYVNVAERFHIIKGVTGAAVKYILRKFSVRIEIPTVSIESEDRDICPQIISLKMDIIMFA